MPSQAAYESSGVKPEMSRMTNHKKAETQIYFSRAAGCFFLSFVRELRKRKTKSSRSSKSCQIRKSPSIIEFLRRLRVEVWA